MDKIDLSQIIFNLTHLLDGSNHVYGEKKKVEHGAEKLGA